MLTFSCMEVGPVQREAILDCRGWAARAVHARTPRPYLLPDALDIERLEDCGFPASTEAANPQPVAVKVDADGLFATRALGERAAVVGPGKAALSHAAASSSRARAAVSACVTRVASSHARPAVDRDG